jgi:hypothetical protein
MSVRERMEALEEEMDARFGRKFEIKTVREWLAEAGYVPPENPSDVSSEVRTLLGELASLGIVVEFVDHLSDRELYAWLNEHLGGHVALKPEDFLFLSPIEGDEQIYLMYYATDKERAEWKARFPERDLPPKKEPRYTRE